MAVAYEACLAGEILVCTVTYTGTGNSAPCSSVEVRAAFTSNEEVREITCDPRAIAIPRTSLGRVTVNPDETCPCGVPVPVEETSWGRVQALYD
jgi:hypothetical protein